MPMKRLTVILTTVFVKISNDYIDAEERVNKIIDRMSGSYIEYSTAMQKVIAKYGDFAKAASGKPLKEQLIHSQRIPQSIGQPE